MANYNVQITNGVGSTEMKSGQYDVTVSLRGYDPSTLSPTTFTAPDFSYGANFTVSANGTLTLIFNETGAAGGTPVTGGSVVMTDSTGETQYGSPIAIGANGEAVFEHVPYDGDEPFVLYFKQLSTDDNHNVATGIITVNMSEANQTEYVLNTPIALQTFSLTDVNYGVPIPSAILTFTGE